MSSSLEEIRSQPDLWRRAGVLATVPGTEAALHPPHGVEAAVVGYPMATLVLAQRFAVAAAEARSLDPDRPRNLTGSVILP